MSDYDRNAVRWGQGAAQTRSATVDQGLRSYMVGVYNHMMIGLLLTGVSAYLLNVLSIAQPGAEGAVQVGRFWFTPLGAAVYLSPLKFVIMLAPLAFVFFFSFRINQMRADTARTLFYVFAAVMGLSLSSVLLIYTGASVYRAFFITAAAFGGLSLYGYTTQRDLSPMGSFLIMGVFGLVLVGLVNLFVHSSGLQLALSVLSVLIFSGLTAYDTQAIKEMYYEGDGYEVMTKKSVNGALMLYLDFINIFTSLLQLTGQRDN